MKTVNGTSYPDGTPDDLIQILEDARLEGRSRRLRITYQGFGAPPFSCWLGRSTGTWKVPLAMRSVRSIGGEPLSVEHIIRVERRGRRDLYEMVWKRQS